MRKLLLSAALALPLAGCMTTDTQNLAPASPTTPAGGGTSFALTPDARVLEGRAAKPVSTRHAYSLPQLIDIAQRNNPKTRAAWLRARQAAEAVGLVETVYLPRINAHILATGRGTKGRGARDPLELLPEGQVALGGSQAAALVSIRWLLFDFGGREAARAQAKEASFASNIAFNGAHQRLIYTVSQAYHDLHAAERREAVHRRRLGNARTIAAQADARRGKGLATITDVSQAQQVVAQARFDLARAQSKTAQARTALTTSVGLPAAQQIRPSFRAVRLPSRVPPALDRHLRDALSRRPDLQAAFARARASDAHIAMVEAEFRPKIIASASLGHTFASATLDDSRVPGSRNVSGDRPIASIGVGVTIPLWSGGAKKARLQAARTQAELTRNEAESLRLLAENEIVTAYELLKSSLAANAAATQLIATSRTSYSAARSFMEKGLATVDKVSLAQQLLFDAEIAQIEAQHAAQSAALTLALASGQLGG